MTTYKDILDQKRRAHKTSGFNVDQSDLNPLLFDFQKFTVQRCLELGKAAIFADCGLGKTLMQLEWARQVAARNGNVLILCPLQLPVIERLIHLYTNKGDTVLTPFMGIGSEVYQAVKMERKGIGFELKKSYFNQAKKNVAAAVLAKKQAELF